MAAGPVREFRHAQAAWGSHSQWACREVSASAMMMRTSRMGAVRAFAGDAVSGDKAHDGLAPLYEIPKGKPGEVPSSFDQSAGVEKMEIEKPDLWAKNEVIRGPFGTVDAPTFVESAFETRIVGCTGDESPNDHDLLWILVEDKQQAQCPLCEQVFQLKRVDVE